MLKLNDIRNKLSKRDIKLKDISDKTGVNLQTIYRLLKPHTEPKYSTVERLSDYIERHGI